MLHSVSNFYVMLFYSVIVGRRSPVLRDSVPTKTLPFPTIRRILEAMGFEWRFVSLPEQGNKNKNIIFSQVESNPRAVTLTIARSQLVRNFFFYISCKIFLNIKIVT